VRLSARTVVRAGEPGTSRKAAAAAPLPWPPPRPRAARPRSAPRPWRTVVSRERSFPGPRCTRGGCAARLRRERLGVQARASACMRAARARRASHGLRRAAAVGRENGKRRKEQRSWTLRQCDPVLRVLPTESVSPRCSGQCAQLIQRS
jgi:hypothetical protein